MGISICLRYFVTLSKIGALIGCAIIALSCYKNALAKCIDEMDAIEDFTIQCPGENLKCNENEVTITNVGKKSYSDLVVICKNKHNPNAPEDKPYYIFPFSLDPNETKCMNAKAHCLKSITTDTQTGKKLEKYVTLVQIDSNHEPIWKKPQDCHGT